MKETKPYLKKTDKAWIAGIIDGEGSLSLPKHQSKVQVGNTDFGMLERLKELCGGKIYNSGRKKYNKRHKPCKFWVLYKKEKVKKFLKEIYPYLVCKSKREKAEELLKWN